MKHKDTIRKAICVSLIVALLSWLYLELDSSIEDAVPPSDGAGSNLA